MLNLGAEGPGFKSQSRSYRVTVLGKLLTPIVPLFTKQQKLVAALLSVARAWRKVMAAYHRVYDSRHLQADCQGPGSVPEPYARQSSMGYLYVFYHKKDGHDTWKNLEMVCLACSCMLDTFSKSQNSGRSGGLMSRSLTSTR